MLTINCQYFSCINSGFYVSPIISCIILMHNGKITCTITNLSCKFETQQRKKHVCDQHKFIVLFQEQLLQQALQVVLNGHVEFGYVSNPKEIIRMKSLLVKSEQQKEAVRTAPEFLRCTQEEQLERPLADVCELVRHQAASVDEVEKVTIQI